MPRIWPPSFTKQKSIGEISGICKTRIQQQQTAAAEFGTFLLKTAMVPYGAQNSSKETGHGYESSFSLNLYVQSLRPAHDRYIKRLSPHLRCLFESQSTARLSRLCEFVSGSLRRDFLYRYMHFVEIASAACNRAPIASRCVTRVTL